MLISFKRAERAIGLWQQCQHDQAKAKIVYLGERVQTR